MTNTRKVALLTQTGRIEMRRLPMPVPGPEDVLIRIRAVGVCGSDVSYFRNGRTGVGAIRFPHILGHECAGVVEAAGSRVRTLKAGDPVCIEPGYFCGKCPQCTQGNYNLCRDMSFMGSAVAHDYGEGALVEYSLRPAHLTFKLPENVGFDLGAMVEPLSVGLQAVRSGRVPAGGRAVVMGCGPIGACILIMLKALSAGEVIITDVQPSRLKAMEAMDARTIDVSGMDEAQLRELLADASADAVFDTSCVEAAINAALHWLKKGGRLVQVGVPAGRCALDMQTLFNRGIALIPSFRYANTYPAVLQLLSTGRLPADRLITHRFPFDATQQAFELAASRSAEVMKVLIEL